jgi:glycosyltransferase involved in cell wall biosynthesis
MKFLIVSDLSIYALAHSYIRALKKEGHEVEVFDIKKAVSQHIQFGSIGNKINTFWPVHAWLRKANRQLAVKFQQCSPDIVIVFGNAPVLYGTLAFFRSISKSKLVLYWPDTLINLEQQHINAAGLYDVVASYSAVTMPVFERIGFHRTLWLPFAGDIDFLAGSDTGSEEYICDLSFAGAWRPEREKAISRIIDFFPSIKFFVRGNYWKKNCKDERIIKNLSSQSLFGKEFGDFFRSSRINLNVIDDTNYPAANMRFFEVPASGALQLSSSCPEMGTIFQNQEHILYFHSEKEMAEQIRFVLDNPDKAAEIRKNAFQFVQNQHTYSKRVEELIKN